MAKAKRKPTPKEGKAPLKSRPLLDFGFEQRQRLFDSAIKSLKRREQRKQQFERRLIESLERLGPARAAPPSPPVGKLSGKAWVPLAYARRPNELLAMGISDAARVLANEYETYCGKPLKPRSVEKILRGLGIWTKAFRGSPKQRRK